MTLPSQKYANNTREVNGTVTVYDDDVILRVNTSLGAATINLNAIPAGYFNTQYRLYVYDASNNAAVNNITIVAGSGQTINGAASIVLSTSGQRVVIKISSNTSYLAEGYNTSGTASVTSAQFYSVVGALSTRIDTVSNAVSTLSQAVSVVSVAAANALSVANTKNPILTVQDEGSLVQSAAQTINFKGGNIRAHLSVGVVVVSVQGGGAASVTSGQLASAVNALSNAISATSVAAANALSATSTALANAISVVSVAAANALSVANARNKILDIQNESSTTLSNPIGIDFQGAGVSVTASGQMAIVKIDGGTNFLYARKTLQNSAVTYVPAATIGEKSFIAGAELSDWTSVDNNTLSGFNLSTGIFTAPIDGWFGVNAKLVTRINPTDVNNPANSAGTNWVNAETYSAEGIGFFAIGVYDKTNDKVITSNKQVVTKSTSDINIDCSIHAIYLTGGNQYAVRVLNKTDYPVIGIPGALSLPVCEVELAIQKLI